MGCRTKFSLALLVLALVSAAPGVAVASDGCMLPATCADIAAADPGAGDGDYVIYPQAGAFEVDLDDMAGAPREYLTLGQAGLGVNFSSYAWSDAAITASRAGCPCA